MEAGRHMRIPLRRERTEDEFIASYRELLAVVQRVYDLGGDPQIKLIVERANSALGRVPH